MTIEEAARNYRLLLANNLKRLLNEKGWSRNELARRMGVTSTIASAWARGDKYPSSENIDKLCQLFGCARVDIMEEPIEAARYHQSKRIEAYARMLDQNADILEAVELLRRVPAEELPRVIEMIKIFAKEDPNEEAK